MDPTLKKSWNFCDHDCARQRGADLTYRGSVPPPPLSKRSCRSHTEYPKIWNPAVPLGPPPPPAPPQIAPPQNTQHHPPSCTSCAPPPMRVHRRRHPKTVIPLNFLPPPVLLRPSLCVSPSFCCPTTFTFSATTSQFLFIGAPPPFPPPNPLKPHFEGSAVSSGAGTSGGVTFSSWWVQTCSTTVLPSGPAPPPRKHN